MSDVKHFSRARCCAITSAGKRCSGRWRTAIHIMYEWDPVAGIGCDGPKVVFCHRHRHWADNRRARRRIFRGWLGGIAPHYHYWTVYAKERGATLSRWWWNKRRTCAFDMPGRVDSV